MKRLMLVCMMILCLVPLGAWAEEETTPALYPIRENGLWGYMNRAGEVVIEPQWAYVWPFGGETALVSTYSPTDLSDDPPNGNGVIDRDGNYVIAPTENIYVETYQFAYRVWFCNGNDDTSYEGFYDCVSGFYQPPEPEYHDVMLWGDDGSGPIAIRNKDGLTGYVSRTNGEIVIPFVYSGESMDVAFRSGYARPAEEILITDANGITMMHGSKMHLIDTQGNEISFPSNVKPVSSVQNGYLICMVEIEGWEWENDLEMEDDESWIGEEDSDDGWYLGNGTQIALPLYRVNRIAGTREELENPESIWEEDDTCHGYALAMIDGTIISEPDPEIAYMWLPDSDGMVCIVSYDSTCGHMDLNGNIIVEPRYVIDFGGSEIFYDFHHGYAVIEDCGEDFPDSYRWVIIDTAGNEVFSSSKSSNADEDFSLCDQVIANGLCWYHTASGYGLLKIAAHGIDYISGPVYEASLGCGMYDNPVEMEFIEGLHPVRQNGLWGYIDENAQWIIPPQYDKAAGFSDGLALVEKDGQLMYIDHSGAVVWEER